VAERALADLLRRHDRPGPAAQLVLDLVDDALEALERDAALLTGTQQAVEQFAPGEQLLRSAALDHDERHLLDTLVGRVAAFADEALAPPADGVARLRLARVDDPALFTGTVWTTHRTPPLSPVRGPTGRPGMNRRHHNIWCPLPVGTSI